MNPSAVHHISECFIKPKYITEEQKQPYHLTPWDLAMLSVHYIQKGLLFAKPPSSDNQEFRITDFLSNIKDSLSLALVHFYPLAGRLATSKSEDPAAYVVHVDCNDSPGAGFIHAAVDLTMDNILSPTYVPLVVQAFFDHDRAVNHDGHTRPLLTVQVTELIDGIFIGCSINHCLVDGSSFWQFFNAFSEIFQAKGGDDVSITHPPILKRWFPEGHGPVINLPFTHQDQFLSRFTAPVLKERMFHFSAESIAKLKAKANAEADTNKISSFQSLSALVWRCITRARNLPQDQVTSCRLAINNRTRLNPPLPEDYFGNSIQVVVGVSTAGEVLNHNLGWAAWQLHQAVVNHDDKQVRDFIDSWLQSPSIYQLHLKFDPYSIMMGSSPRFNKYGCQFGLGKAVALRSGYANKFSGKVSSYPGNEGGGSVDLEMCLPPDQMDAIESDDEFMEAVSPSYYQH